LNALKVVQVNYTYHRGLADPEALVDCYTTLTGWSDAVAAAGAVVTSVQRFHRAARIVRNGVEYVFCRSRDIQRTVNALDPDVVHVNGLVFPARTWLLRKMLPAAAAIAVQDHGSMPPGSRLGAARLRAGLRAADGFLFASMAQANPWRRAGLIAADQQVFEVMEASTSIRPIARGEARRATNLSGDPALLWVGRLNANKDPLTVLDGFERCIEHLPRASLTMIYGTEELLPDVRARLRSSAALSEHVSLVGRIPHERMAPFFSAADLFVVGSHHEGSGYALLEACACGVTPVVTDIPSFRAIVGPGSSSALWTPGDGPGFAAALIRAARSDARPIRLALIEHFDRCLSWRAIGRRAVEIYRTVVARRRTGPAAAAPPATSIRTG
jgi:glycosyltransferase involved in cell wall biosynthesis